MAETTSVSPTTAKRRQPIAPEYANTDLIITKNSRLHRIVALLLDTYIDDLSDDRRQN